MNLTLLVLLRLAFIHFLEEIEDTKKIFRNYLTFTWKSYFDYSNENHGKSYLDKQVYNINETIWIKWVFLTWLIWTTLFFGSHLQRSYRPPWNCKFEKALKKSLNMGFYTYLTRLLCVSLATISLVFFS